MGYTQKNNILERQKQEKKERDEIMERHNIKPEAFEGIETADGVKVFDFANHGNAFINL